MNHLTHETIALEPLLDSDTANGAVLLFTGIVRNKNDGRPVDGMSYTAYEPLAEKAMASICAEARQRFAITDCQIIHRLGRLKLGDISVAIAIHSPHRDEAYSASRWAIEELKRSVPVFKEEHYCDGDSRHLDGQTLDAAL